MADVDLTITIPDEWIAKTVDAFTRSSGEGARIKLLIEKSILDLNPELQAAWVFNIPEQGEEETLIEFGERFLRTLGIAVINAIDKKDDEDRYEAEVAALDPPASDVPEDILT